MRHACCCNRTALYIKGQTMAAVLCKFNGGVASTARLDAFPAGTHTGPGVECEHPRTKNTSCTTCSLPAACSPVPRCRAAAPAPCFRPRAVKVRQPAQCAQRLRMDSAGRHSRCPIALPAVVHLRACAVGHHAKPMTRRAPACKAAKGPVVVIDNYDSFTYNLCQVRTATSCCMALLRAGS